MNERTCSVGGCGRPHKGRGFCAAHLRRSNLGQPVDVPLKPTYRGARCSVDACEKPARVAGLCSMHWQRQKAGVPMDAPEQIRNLGQSCAVEECENPSRKRGWCSKHYERWLKHGDVSVVNSPLKGACILAWCDRPHHSHGYCLPHARRAKDGRPLDVRLRPFRAGPCAIDGCDEVGGHRGMCRNHYMQAEYALNQEPFKARAAFRRQRTSELPPEDREISASYREAIRNDPCAYCGSSDATDTDHVFPLARGGSDAWFNLVRACEPCNSRKWAHCGTWFRLRKGFLRAPSQSTADVA